MYCGKVVALQKSMSLLAYSLDVDEDSVVLYKLRLISIVGINQFSCDDNHKMKCKQKPKAFFVPLPF